MTKNDIIYRLKEKLSSYNIGDDNDIDNRLIGSWIDTKRAVLLRQDAVKNRSYDPDIIQDLGCIEMELADIAECCDVSSCRYILRTKQLLPSFIELYNRTGITRVGIIDKLSVKINFIDYERAKYAGSNKFNQYYIYAFLRNNRIYMISNDPLVNAIKWINIQGVLETPEDASNFTCNSVSCYDPSTTKYPIKSWMVDMLESMIIQENYGYKLGPKDDVNDGSDNNLNMNIKK